METTKICTKCNTVKELSQFNKQKSSKDGHMYMCRKCSIKEKLIYYRTKDGLLRKIYTSQKKRCKLKNRPQPYYSFEELKQWILSQKDFNILYKEWEESNFSKMKTPSIDRIDNSKYYEFSNIKLTTWEVNKNNGHKDMRLGNIIHGNKPHIKVKQYTKDMKFIKEFVSSREAERSTGIYHSAILKVCRKVKHYNTAGGFIWRFV